MKYNCDVTLKLPKGSMVFPDMDVNARTTMDAVKWFENYFSQPVLNVVFNPRFNNEDK